MLEPITAMLAWLRRIQACHMANAMSEKQRSGFELGMAQAKESLEKGAMLAWLRRIQACHMANARHKHKFVEENNEWQELTI